MIFAAIFVAYKYVIGFGETFGVYPAGSGNVKNASSILVLVNKQHNLSSYYAPTDLVKVDIPFGSNMTDEEKTMRREAALSLSRMFKAAASEGIKLCGVSGYRSYRLQKRLYNEKLRTMGKDYVDEYVAMPGESEHQTGLAMDVGSLISTGNCDFGSTREGKWLKRNAQNYGFILRYPQGREDVTGYSYEPWHVRYVGIKAAKKIKTENLVLEEYIDAPSEK